MDPATTNASSAADEAAAEDDELTQEATRDGSAPEVPHEVWERIQARIEADLVPVDIAIARLLESPLEATVYDDALESLATLTTWFADLGLFSGARLARQLRSTLDNPGHLASPNIPAAVLAAGNLEDLRAALATSHSSENLKVALGDTLLVIGQPSQVVDSLIWYAVTRGFTVHHAHHLSGWTTAPDAVAMVGDPGSSISSSLMTVRSAAERYPGVPLVMINGYPLYGDRLELAQQVTSMVDMATRPSDVIDEVRRQIHLTRRTVRVIVRGEGSEEYAERLKEGGMEASAAASNLGTLAALDSGGANVLVLMPQDDNPSFVRLMRAQPSTRSSLIVEMVAAKGVKRPAPRSGVDLALPVATHATLCIGEIRGILALRDDLDIDESADSTGSVPWSAAQFLAERLLLGVQRSGSVASVCVVKFSESDSVESVDDVQEMLAKDFRTDDVVARSGDHENILVLTGLGQEVAQARLNGLVQRLTSVRARVGVAEFPYDAQSVPDLVDRAREALQLSSEKGGPVVVGAGWSNNAVQTGDVMVADSDPAVARVVRSALEREALTVEHVSSGRHLIERLTAEDAKLPKLLLLEFDLEGIDGLGVLQRLQERGMHRRLHIVMLSARARESDLQRAFDLGVTDVMSKPFSPSLLVRRLERMLETTP